MWRFILKTKISNETANAVKNMPESGPGFTFSAFNSIGVGAGLVTLTKRLIIPLVTFPPGATQ
jgi:hypothetical protein